MVFLISFGHMGQDALRRPQPSQTQTLGAVLFMGQILPTINETIAIQNLTFVDQVMTTLRSVNLEGWRASFVVEHEGNNLIIKTKRRLQIPYDSAILRGTIMEGQFRYEIKPRKSLLLLMPWYLFAFVGLVVSIIATFSSMNSLIPALFFAAMILLSWRNISNSYKKDLIILHKVIEQNKKHST